MSSVRVVRPGLQTTVQDAGRWGWQARGVPVAGPMDPISHRVANAMVGNAADAATLEITLTGPELTFEDRRIVAIAGAEFAVSLDGSSVPADGPFEVKPAARLAFGARGRGVRAYLAIAGGIVVPPVMGSRATHLPSRIGGIDGRALKAGDRLPLGEARHASLARFPAAAGAARRLPIPGTATSIRMMAGPQRERFADTALDILQSAPYLVSVDSDRMGFRLEGPRLPLAGGADIISDATPLGALQVPGSGFPMLLMADRQTTGGYPKIATMIAADVALAGQLGPGDRIRFEVCSRPAAISALIAQERTLMALEDAVRR
jgi:antagonist of KipI